MRQSCHTCDNDYVEMLKIQITYIRIVRVMSQKNAFCHKWAGHDIYMCDKDHAEMLKIQIAYFGTVWVMSQQKAFCHQWLSHVVYETKDMRGCSRFRSPLLGLCESCHREFVLQQMVESSRVRSENYVEILKITSPIGIVWVMSQENVFCHIYERVISHIRYGICGDFQASDRLY